MVSRFETLSYRHTRSPETCSTAFPNCDYEFFRWSGDARRHALIRWISLTCYERARIKHMHNNADIQTKIICRKTTTKLFWSAVQTNAKRRNHDCFPSLLLSKTKSLSTIHYNKHHAICRWFSSAMCTFFLLQCCDLNVWKWRLFLSRVPSNRT